MPFKIRVKIKIGLIKIVFVNKMLWNKLIKFNKIKFFVKK